MKYKAITLLSFFLLPLAAAVAGPFHTNVIIGNGAPFDFTLMVPANRAVTITSFVMFNQAGDASDIASVTVSTGTPGSETGAIRLLYSASPDATSSQKDFTIAGPAKIQVNVPHLGYQALLTYKTFAN